MPDAVLMKTCWNVTICSLGETNIFVLHKAKERNEAIQNAFKRINICSWVIFEVVPKLQAKLQGQK